MMTTAHTPAKTFLVNIRLRVVLVCAMALPMLVLYAVSTLGPVLARDLHFKPELLGYLVTSSFGLAAILSLKAAPFVDRVGARYALLLLFSTIALAFSLIATTDSYYGLVAAAAICGVAQAIANPVTNLLIAQQVPLEKKAGVVGLKQSGVQLAALFAGLVLPGIASRHGWEWAFGAIVPVALLFALTTPFVTTGRHARAGREFSLSSPNPLLSRLMATQLCVGISLSAFVTFLPTFATGQNMPLSLASTLIAAFGVMGMLSRIVLTPMSARLKDESLLLAALIAVAGCALTVTLLAGPETHWPLWAGAAGMGMTAVSTNAIAMSMLIREPAFGPVTMASSFVSVAFFGGFALGPALCGALSDYSGNLRYGWIAMTGVLLCGFLMALSLASARRHRAQTIASRFKHTTVVDV